MKATSCDRRVIEGRHSGFLLDKSVVEQGPLARRDERRKHDGPIGQLGVAPIIAQCGEPPEIDL